MRLFAQLYVAILAAIAAMTVASALAGAWWLRAEGGLPSVFVGAVREMGRGLPPADAPVDVQAAGVVALSARTGLPLDLYAADGAPLQVDQPLAGPLVVDGPAARLGRAGDGFAVRLPDGRALVVAREDRGPIGRFLVAVGLAGAAAALAAWPVSRRLTRRLERLTDGVAAFGDDLSVRLPAAGRDEVAVLATAFNRSAERIQGLVTAQRRVLASASHELRSPLARLRMSLALLDDDPHHAQMAAGAVQDLDALDALVAELLLVGRVGAGGLQRAPVDLGALARAVAGDAVSVAGEGSVPGDAAAIRRLLVNLLENARRHGAPPIQVAIADGAITVTDAGPGVPEAERERIFEAFYRPAGHHEGRDGGVGLGLALVREIARAHGGDVRCERGPAGVGVRFRVWLTPSAVPHPAL